MQWLQTAFVGDASAFINKKPQKNSRQTPENRLGRQAVQKTTRHFVNFTSIRNRGNMVSF
jgi:hypothetical protein